MLGKGDRAQKALSQDVWRWILSCGGMSAWSPMIWQQSYSAKVFSLVSIAAGVDEGHAKPPPRSRKWIGE